MAYNRQSGFFFPFWQTSLAYIDCLADWLFLSWAFIPHTFLIGINVMASQQSTKLKIHIQRYFWLNKDNLFFKEYLAPRPIVCDPYFTCVLCCLCYRHNNSRSRYYFLSSMAKSISANIVTRGGHDSAWTTTPWKINPFISLMSLLTLRRTLCCIFLCLDVTWGGGAYSLLCFTGCGGMTSITFGFQKTRNISPATLFPLRGGGGCGGGAVLKLSHGMLQKCFPKKKGRSGSGM